MKRMWFKIIACIAAFKNQKLILKPKIIIMMINMIKKKYSENKSNKIKIKLER